MGVWPPNPYDHLQRYLTTVQLEEVYASGAQESRWTRSLSWLTPKAFATSTCGQRCMSVSPEDCFKCLTGFFEHIVPSEDTFALNRRERQMPKLPKFTLTHN